MYTLTFTNDGGNGIYTVPLVCSSLEDNAALGAVTRYTSGYCSAVGSLKISVAAQPTYVLTYGSGTTSAGAAIAADTVFVGTTTPDADDPPVIINHDMTGTDPRLVIRVRVTAQPEQKLVQPANAVDIPNLISLILKGGTTPLGASHYDIVKKYWTGSAVSNTPVNALENGYSYSIEFKGTTPPAAYEIRCVRMSVPRMPHSTRRPASSSPLLVPSPRPSLVAVLTAPSSRTSTTSWRA